MVDQESSTPKRLPAAERREQMLSAASIVFGERGYAGTTTDAIAKEAGVSQAYIVRTFGSKESLFVEAATRSVDKTIEVFRAAARDNDDLTTLPRHLGHAYVELVADRGILLTMMHLFTMGHHERFGKLAREEFARIYRVLHHELGLTAQKTEKILARGMLINAILGMRLTDVIDTDPDVEELLSCTFADEAHMVADLISGYEPLPPAARGRTSS
ncbi:TetR/AcrR family transcriptional regulator [Rothia dentocariosa]